MKNKSKLFAIVIIVAVLGLAVAYASFNGVLNISGRANASGKFEVAFTNGVVSTSEHGRAIVNEADNTKMTVDIDLSYPGDGCFVTATVKNNGNVPAKLTGFNIYNHGTATAFSNDDIEVLIPNLEISGIEVLQAGETTPITFTVKWKKDSVKESASAEFDIELDYEQATQEFAGNA